MIPDSIEGICKRVAAQVSRVYERRFPAIPREDFAQEAHASMLANIFRIDVKRGDAGGLLYRVASVACKRLAWQMGAVANGGAYQPAGGEAARQRAASVDASALESVPHHEATPEAKLDACQRRARLAAIVARHLAEGHEGQAVLAVLTGEMSSAEAAAAYAVPVTTLYWRTAETKKALRRDSRLLEFV